MTREKAPLMNKVAVAERYVSLRCANSDLRVVAGGGVDPSGFTLLAVLRNEMYFLPHFLAHYRRLGVERFVFLDDRSFDGSREYLCQQSDAVIVESGRRYGEVVEMISPAGGKVRKIRMIHLWRSLLHDLFVPNRWAVQVDLDELVHLPQGMNFQDVVAQLDRRDARAVWGVMLDVYPKDIEELAGQEGTSRLDMTRTWYFDGEPHLRLRTNRRPRVIHPSARTRLYSEYGVNRLTHLSTSKRRRKTRHILGKILPGFEPLTYNAIWKPVLLKWGRGCYFKNSHICNLSASSRYLFPIQHFRFTGSLYQKIQIGLRENSYHNDSADHRILSELLKTMKERNGSFLYPKSRPFDCFDDLSATRNALGL